MKISKYGPIIFIETRTYRSIYTNSIVTVYEILCFLKRCTNCIFCTDISLLLVFNRCTNKNVIKHIEVDLMQKWQLRTKPNIDNVLANIIGFMQSGRQTDGQMDGISIACNNKVQFILKMTCFADVLNLSKRF